jgi:hypothetical protein
MEQLVNEIRVAYADRVINERLTAPRQTAAGVYTRHFNQSEEYFLQFEKPFIVPRFPIHHDVRQAVPRTDYMNSLRDWVDGFLEVAPDFFTDLSYFFDPGEVLKPCFYRLYRIGERYYLYLLRANLIFRPMEGEVLERGSNDTTSVYRTRRFYLESDFIPLASVLSELGKVMAFIVRQSISQTWIGETGKGYMMRGIWIDSELSKFFSKLVLPAGRRSYPFLPYTCKYKTVCMTVADPSAELRRQLLPQLHRYLTFLTPEMEGIQQALKSESFDESIPLFGRLKGSLPPALAESWSKLAVTAYLNELEQKEYRLEL